MAEEEAVDGYTQDGTVDLKGKPVRRSNSGGWRACWFIVGNILTSLSLSLSLSNLGSLRFGYPKPT
jgi:hypothetical protein